ncbi:MAG: ATP-binding protein [Myxococcota bacterium]|nr:ATP-binding protein [Myxococcota bacterium]
MSNVYELFPDRDLGGEAPASVTSSGTLSGDAERRQLREALAEREAELSLLAQVISHDLRSPLRAIAGFGELLQEELDGKLDETQLDYMRRVIEGADRMHEMIDALVSYLRLGPAELQPVELGSLVDELIAERAARADVSRGELPRVEADPALVRQLIDALLENSLRFRDPERPPNVRVEARREGERWVIEVRDEGIGFDPQHAERAREIFAQLHPRGRYPGLGVGLAFATKIAHLHDAELWIESAPGQGTAVRFHLASAS